MTRQTHKLRILKTLYETGRALTATDFTHVSNINQYFVELERAGLIASFWGVYGNARVKFRLILVEQRQKVREYLEKHGVLKEAKQDEGKESVYRLS